MTAADDRMMILANSARVFIGICGRKASRAPLEWFTEKLRTDITNKMISVNACQIEALTLVQKRKRCVFFNRYGNDINNREMFHTCVG